MIKRLTKREQVIFIVCLLLVLVYVGYRAVAKPLEEKLFFLDDEIEAQQKKLKKNLGVINKAKGLSQQYSKYLEGMKQSGTNEQVMTSLLAEIQEIAAQLGLKISDLKPKRVKKEEYYNYFSVSLTLDGDLKEILQFVYILQKEPHLFHVNEFNFEKGAQRNSQEIKTRLILSRILIPETKELSQ